jgi:asparagine synthase (glutamine-hydrolysing)
LIAGIFGLQRQPVNMRCVTEEVFGASYPPRELRLRKAGDHVGFVFRVPAIFATSDGAAENGTVCKYADISLVFDGRIDNQKELFGLLNISSDAGVSDALLFLLCYKRWGLGALPRIVGDFALSLWDLAVGQLILARDVFGIRPLYYYCDSESLIWSSRAISLLNLASIPRDIDETFVVGFLGREADSSISPFRRIRPLKPGHYLTCSGGQASTQRYWDIDPALEVRYKSDREYEERFRGLFYDAVASRLRGVSTAAAELSGGLDSSSIVCVADDCIRKGRIGAVSLHTLSAVFAEAKSSDERSYIAIVERHRGRKGNHVVWDDHTAFREWEDVDFLDYPRLCACTGSFSQRMFAELRTLGAQVLLSGTGGDEVMLGQQALPLGLADLLRQGEIRNLLLGVVPWSRFLRSSLLHLLWHAVFRPNLRRSIVGPSARGLDYSPIPPWLDAGLVRRTGFCGPALAACRMPPFRLPSQREHYRRVMMTADTLALGYGMLAGAGSSTEMRFPFFHRPLVEFQLAIPFDQKLRIRQDRSIQRRALAGILPDQIAARRGKGSPAEAVFRDIERNYAAISELMATSRVFARGYVNKRLFLADLERSRYGCSITSAGMIRVLCLEVWLRALENWKGEVPCQNLLTKGGECDEAQREHGLSAESLRTARNQ